METALMPCLKLLSPLADASMDRPDAWVTLITQATRICMAKPFKAHNSQKTGKGNNPQEQGGGKTAGTPLVYCLGRFAGR